MPRQERIARMESLLNRAAPRVEALRRALDAYEEIEGDLKELEAYYTGPGWREDYAADERGELPEDLPRGVLSEDALWNLLADRDALEADLVRRAKKEDE